MRWKSDDYRRMNASRDTEIERIAAVLFDLYASPGRKAYPTGDDLRSEAAALYDAGLRASQPASEPTTWAAPTSAPSLEPTITIPVSKLDALVAEVASREPSLDVERLARAMRWGTRGTRVHVGIDEARALAPEIAAEYQRLSQPADNEHSHSDPDGTNKSTHAHAGGETEHSHGGETLKYDHG